MGVQWGVQFHDIIILGYKERDFGRSVPNTYLSAARIYTYEDTDLLGARQELAPLIFYELVNS